MKLLLAHGYFLAEDRVEKEVMRPYPPLGLLYVSAYLDQQGIRHAVFDSTFKTRDDFFQAVHDEKPDVIGFYANFLTRRNILQMVGKIRQQNDLKKIKVVLGGPDVRYHAEKYLENGIDFIVVGEGEQTFYELIRAIQTGQDLHQIDGLIFREEEQIFKTADRSHIRDLDELPFPNRQKIDLQQYLDSWKTKHGNNSITINTQRGCPYTCNWCSHAVFGDTYRRRSPTSVVAEIDDLVRQYQPDAFWFVDDVFTMSERWIDGFAEELSKKQLTIRYECISRADKLNEDVIIKLKNTGCITLWIGAESGSQHVIDLMDRRVEVTHVQEMIQLAKKHGIEAGTFIMLGYPGETIKDIHETIHHLKVSEPDTFTINLAYPIKGTRLYDEVDDQIIGQNKWAETPDREIDFKRTYRRAFYGFAIRKVYNAVYAHRSLKNNQYSRFIKHSLKSWAAGVFMILTK